MDGLVQKYVKKFTNASKLRDLKFKKYPFWRIDKRNLQIIWGLAFFFFANARDIANKIKSYSHGEFNTR